MENIFFKLYQKKEEYDDLLQDLCYELLKKWERYKISEIKIGLIYHLLEKKKETKINIDPTKFINNLGDCFIITYPDGRKECLSELKFDYLLFDEIIRKTDDIVYKLEKDPYKKFNWFDAKKLHFEGKTIIITDPCYCIKRDDIPYEEPFLYRSNLIDSKESKENITIQRLFQHYEETKRQKELLNKKERTREELGIINYIENQTIYGDWGCTVYRREDDSILGKFCADSGTVGVFDLSEILIHNPEFKEWALKHPWCVTIIDNFTGDVWMEIEGDREDNYSVHVVGEGTVNFKSFQTSL